MVSFRKVFLNRRNLVGGTHERELPARAAHDKLGNQCWIYFYHCGRCKTVRGWTPLEGPYHGFRATHNEPLAIGDFFTQFDEDRKVR
jgi:homospermidine synthase